MKVFMLDTTRKKARIYIFDTENNNFEYKYVLDENVKHSEGLFLYIEKALLECCLNIDDFDKFVCVVGPGSFTGIRVGMSVIKAFRKVENIDIVPINMFEVLRNEIKTGIIALNSTSSMCYCAEIKKNEITDTFVLDKVDLVAKASDNDILILDEEQNIINLEYNNIKVVTDLFSLYKSVIIEKINSGVCEEFIPYYLQLSQAERNLKND